ncbi:hypothetical protein PsorP6_012780 [Peronosclerospora sorghi]|uniref:Uncharacterized protein n=1 Tax=Peronosclerospora sorghi TaxID=230839 RepID=A0ACC0WHJ7_9STRA|nr:hypothetical protein PsorP6_012780 [Peronosclerospora sorghi]
MKIDYKKREKLQHLVAYQLMLKYDDEDRRGSSFSIVMAKNMDASTLFGDDYNKVIYVAGTGNNMRPRSNTRSARNRFYGLFNVWGARQIDTYDESFEAKSEYGGVHGVRASVRRWYSTMDVLDFGRRSKFNAEYFDTDDDWLKMIPKGKMDEGATMLRRGKVI